MSKIEIVKKGVTSFSTDAIVNAANSHLQAGGGVCGAVFRDAGYDELTAACNKIGYCPTGSAVITPGFNLQAKYIIHAVGPVWEDGNSGEPQKLYGCYKKSLELARENNCRSVAFPLISSGIFGYPMDKAWQKALQACLDFIEDNIDYDINIYFAVLNENAKALGEKYLSEVSKKIAGLKGEGKRSDIVLDKKQKRFCLRYVQLLQMIEWDDELKNWCREHWEYHTPESHPGVERMLN